MSETVIKVENISKFYQLGLINHGTLAKDLQAWWAKIRGKDDPNSRISMASNKNANADTDFIYALKDVSFDVKQGEVLGIIGANGAGKSTLLKILSRVTSPTSGCIKIKGRIGSLLEVGTGFHPELTGRENIYLNGAILGMRKHEIDRKLDEIIDFSGVEKFIDTPVKRYSSGMYVRLAFAVAAHLDPEILVVDEVLAVGDADFQKKCLGKMDDVSKKEGRTVLFVSHNMAAVRQLCTRGILLKDGTIAVQDDNINVVVNKYLERNKDNVSTCWENSGNEYENPYFKPIKLEILDKNGRQLSSILTAEEEYIVKFCFDVETINKNLYFDLCFSQDDVGLFTATPCEFIENLNIKKGLNTFFCKIPANIFNNKKYRIDLRALIHKGKSILKERENAPYVYLSIDTKNSFPRPWSDDQRYLHPRFSWEIGEIDA